MKKIAVFVLITLLLTSCMLCACGSKEEIPFDDSYYQASKTYIAFLEAAMKDWPAAVNEFVNLGSTPEDEIAMVLAGESILSYEIIRFEKLSDSLWVVESLTKTNSIRHGLYGVNYVGYVNGKWEVFLNKRILPEALTDGVEIPDYELHEGDFPDEGTKRPILGPDD